MVGSGTLRVSEPVIGGRGTESQMRKLLLLLLLLVPFSVNAEPTKSLRIDYCRGECDRIHPEKGTWGTQWLDPPDGETCEPRVGLLVAIKWLAENKPGYGLVGWSCAIKSQSI